MKFSELNPYDIKIGEYHNRRITLTSHNKKPIKVQIPKMYMPFGIAAWGDPPKFNIDFSASNEGYKKKFIDWVKNIEDMVINHISKTSVEIFGEHKPVDTIRSMFNSNVKSNEPYPDKFRVKIDTVWGDTSMPKCDIWDEKGQVNSPISGGLFSSMNGTSIVELSSVYFMDKMIGLVWKMVQLKVTEPQHKKVEDAIDEGSFKGGCKFIEVEE